MPQVGKTKMGRTRTREIGNFTDNTLCENLDFCRHFSAKLPGFCLQMGYSRQHNDPACGNLHLLHAFMKRHRLRQVRHMITGQKTLNRPVKIAILGGGAAGLSVGYFARKSGLPFALFEKESLVGGNAITYRNEDFLFDSGAHRWHDKDPEMTAEVKNLLGDRLRKIFVPSQILHRGRFIDFPLSPLNLLLKLGPWHFTKAAWEVLAARMAGLPADASFEGFALHTYGRTLAERFLLNYSEKLWGAPCRGLSPNIAGKRMKGLSLKTFLREAIRGAKSKTEHLDGSFYYPDYGIGVITDAISKYCGAENIRTNSQVTRVLHDGGRVNAVEVNGGDRHEVSYLVNSLPVNHLLRMMDPQPERKILDLADTLRFRHMVLVVLFLDRPAITKSATVYFPDPDFQFTRLYEPINRSPLMAPPGKTSFAVEIPCHMEDPVWTADESALARQVADRFVRLGWFEVNQLLGSEVRRMAYAYPILELGFEDRIEKINEYLGQFKNLFPAGRGGNFQYIHLHDMFRAGKAITQEIAGSIGRDSD